MSNESETLIFSFQLEILKSYVDEKNPKKIILQFPKNLLEKSFPIKRILEKNFPNQVFYLLCDNLFTDCCLDIVGASHLNFDLLIHFGPACFNEISEFIKIPFLYVFEHENLISNFEEKIKEKNFSNNDNFVVFIDIPYFYHLKEIKKKILTIFDEKKIKFLSLITQNSEIHDKKPVYFGFFMDKNEELPENYKIIYIGNPDNVRFQNICLLENREIYVFWQNEFRKSEQLQDKTLIMKRFNVIEETKTKKIFGILINKVQGSYFGLLYNKIKKMLESRKLKYYKLIINNISESKLNNFPEIDVFIILSCPYNSLYDKKTFYKLIINPFELALALNYSIWTGFINLDNSKFLENIQIIDKEKENQEKIELKTSNELMTINQDNKIVKINDILSTLDRFQERNFQGLEFNQKVEVKLAEKGLSGIASAYEDEIKK